MDLWQYLHETNKKIVLYGTGNGADKVLDRLSADGTPVAGVFAGSGFVRSRTFRGFPVERYEDISARLEDFLVLMCFGSARAEVLENVRRIAAEREFLIADVPVAGTQIFDEAFYETHKEELSQTRAMFADETSRIVFDRLVCFKLTGRPEALFASERPELPPEADLSLPSGATIVDLGAYTGDTAADFLSLYPDCGKLFAVEPEPRNYRRLCALADAQPRVIPVRALAGAADGSAMISAARRGRGSAVSDSGVLTLVIRVDTLLRGAPAHLIKLDVEGEEQNAILGAARTISADRPKLIVSCYHRSTDLFTLPQTVFSIRGDYRMYLRRRRCIPAWECELIFC